MAPTTSVIRTFSSHNVQMTDILKWVGGCVRVERERERGEYNVQHMDPNDYLDVVTIYNRIIQREPIHPKNYKFSSNRVNYIQM